MLRASISCIVFSPAEEKDLAANVAADDYFKQEYTPGRVEYATHILALDGIVRYRSTIEAVFGEEFYVCGKFTAPVSVRRVPTVVAETLSRIIAALEYTGTCSVNYKVEDGVPKLFEINPRPGSSLPLDLNTYLDVHLGLLEELRRGDDD